MLSQLALLLLTPLSNPGKIGLRQEQELPVHRIPNLAAAAEFYFAPDSRHIIGTAKQPGDDAFHEYTLTIEGTEIKRLNDRGEDACAYYFPDGKRVIWTSTKDHLELPKGNYSKPGDYPRGAELYSSNADGSDVRRLTFNELYDAEVSVSPDANKILFGRDTHGQMDLWGMNPDGSNQHQITHFKSWQPGGAFYLPDSKTILFRAWQKSSEGASKAGIPMTLFTVSDDGTGLRQLTHDAGTNWAPFPAPDGHHYVFVKVLPGRNYELFLGDLRNNSQVRLTYNPAFDGFPVISPDAHWLLFASTRDKSAGAPPITLYLMDISSLHLGAAEAKRSQ